MKFLIVGGGGNLGVGCIKALKEIGIQATSWDLHEDIFNLSSRFLADQRFDLVINFSVQVDAKSLAITPSSDDYKVNVLGLFHLIQVCRSVSIPLIHISTKEVIGTRDFRRTKSDQSATLTLVSEREPCLPKYSYGKTKLIAEWLLTDVANTAIIRLNTCYTDNWNSGKGLVGSLVRKSRTDGEVTLDNMGRSMRDPLHVADLASLILMITEKSFFGRVIHAGGGQNNFVTLKEICTMANPDVRVIPGQLNEDFGFLMDISLARSIGWEPKVHFQTWIKEN